MPEPIRISIALCTCNGERFLAEQLESIACQTRIPDEIILCDDASEDRTLEVVRSYANRLPIYIHINERRIGTTSNFSNAIAACSGEIIFLSDQDDIWEPRKVEKIMAIFSATKRPGLVFSDAKLIDQYSHTQDEFLWKTNRFFSERRERFESGSVLEHLLRSNIVTGATAAFRAEFKNNILPIPPNWTHDYWIATIISTMAPLYCEPAPLTQYRIHPDQQIGVRRNNLNKIVGLMSNKVDLPAEREKYLELKKRVELNQKNNSVMGDVIPLINRKLAHIEMRQEIVQRARNRAPKLIREILSGNYSRFSYGWVDVIADAMRAFS